MLGKRRDARMKTSIPPTLTVSPISIRCPFCNAEPTRDCATTRAGFAAIHVQRISEAARISSKKRRIRKTKPQ